MLLDDSESEQLKTWVIKRLEDISDADSDVLADYVLALVKSDEPDEQVKQNCLDNLEDFLHDSTLRSCYISFRLTCRCRYSHIRRRCDQRSQDQIVRPYQAGPETTCAHRTRV